VHVPGVLKLLADLSHSDVSAPVQKLQNILQDILTQPLRVEASLLCHAF